MATAIIFFTSFLSLSWYTAWQNGKGKPARQPQRRPSGLADGSALCSVCVCVCVEGETSESTACLGGRFFGFAARAWAWPLTRSDLVVGTVAAARRVTAGFLSLGASRILPEPISPLARLAYRYHHLRSFAFLSRSAAEHAGAAFSCVLCSFSRTQVQ